MTYSNQIARILQARCVGCHQSGRDRPLLADDLRRRVGWAETIREVVRDQRMPPWFANPKYGKFSERLPALGRREAAVERVDRQRSARGRSVAVCRNRPEFAEGWRIPKPDLIVKMPKPYKVAANGIIEYQYFIVDPGFKHDVWIRAAENRPGNRSVVHHMALFYMPPGQVELEPADLLSRTVGRVHSGHAADDSSRRHRAARPGRVEARLPDALHAQRHRTISTRARSRSSSTIPKKVRKELTMGVIVNFRLLIPPGEANYRVDAGESFDEDTLVYAFLPHMHFRGKSFRFTAIYPGGSKEVLLDVPRYDFNWQNVYWLAEPKLLPAGSRLVCDAAYDNSENNLANPDPTRQVHWGDQTSDEMFVGSYYSVPADQDLSLGSPRITRLGDHRYEAVFRYPAGQRRRRRSLSPGRSTIGTRTDHPMSGPDREGWFTTRLTLPEGYNEYKFLVDGKSWKTDPGNSQQTDSDHNSVISVGAITPPSAARTAGGDVRGPLPLPSGDRRQGSLSGRKLQQVEADRAQDEGTGLRRLLLGDAQAPRRPTRVQVRPRRQSLEVRSQQSDSRRQDRTTACSRSNRETVESRAVQ